MRTLLSDLDQSIDGMLSIYILQSNIFCIIGIVTLFLLHSFHFVLFSYCTFLVFHFFILHFSCIPLFSCYTFFSYCTFPCCNLSRDSLPYCIIFKFHSFRVALFPCCTFFLLYFPKASRD